MSDEVVTWVVEYEGRPIANFIHRDMDWPWHEYEVIPTTDDPKLRELLHKSMFYVEEHEKLEFRHVETNQLAAVKACPTPYNALNGRMSFRGLYLKQWPTENPGAGNSARNRWWEFWKKYSP